MTFDVAVEHVLREEGGYVNNPNDRGGETNFGISKRSYPSLDIRRLTREQAREIYRRDYWRAASCDDMPPRLRVAAFDAAVNCGVGTAVRWAQTVAGVAVDGRVGPATRAAWAAGNDIAMTEDFMWLRVGHHARLAARSSSQRGFLPGWMLRCLRVRTLAMA